MAALGAALLASVPGAAADVDPLFASNDTLPVEIEAPLDMLVEERPDDDEFPGKFRYTAADGSAVELDIVVRTRGRYRRQKETCAFPPLRLNFRKSQVDGTLFDGQDKLKLVSHCRDRSWGYRQAVVAEYLAYRVLNLLTDRSFNVRLLRASYVYSDDDRELDQLAFLVEHKDRLGKRLGARPRSVERTRVEKIDPAGLNLASVFQFFIGNTDFSPIATAPDEDCCHNQLLLERDDGPAYTVPYDFDMSGFVDARHAVTNPRFGLASHRERLYRGRCSNNAYLEQTLQRFRDRRADIEDLIRAQPELADRKERDILEYVDEFYAIIDDPAQVKREIIDRCL